MLRTIASSYFAIAFLVWVVLLTAFWRDRSSAKGSRMSWTIATVAALLWVVALPVSLIELLEKSTTGESDADRRISNG